MMIRFYDTLYQVFYKLAYKAILCLWFFKKPTVYGVYIAIWHKNSILVIRNSYRKRFTIPCGRVKRSEELVEAAVRELQEEVNITVTKSQLDFVGKHSAKFGSVRDVGSFFEIKMSELPEIRVDNREVVWAQFVPLERALALNMIPTVRSYLDEKIKKDLESHSRFPSQRGVVYPY